MRRQWLGDLATICPPPSSLQPTTGACSSYRLRAVSLDAEHLANVITLCDATLRAGGLMSNAHHSQRLRLLFTKGIRFFYRAANGSHLPSDARCSQLLRLGHPSVGNWAACLEQRPTPRWSALPLMDVYRVLIDINTCGTDGATDANQMSYFWLAFHESTGESFNEVVFFLFFF